MIVDLEITNRAIDRTFSLMGDDILHMLKRVRKGELPEAEFNEKLSSWEMSEMNALKNEITKICDRDPHEDLGIGA